MMSRIKALEKIIFANQRERPTDPEEMTDAELYAACGFPEGYTPTDAELEVIAVRKTDAGKGPDHAN